MKKRGLREQLFKLLFRVEFNTPDEMPLQEKLFFDSGDQIITDKDKMYLTARMDEIMTHLPEIDEKLSKSIEGWNLSRIGKVELTILRLALYEMLYDPDMPEGVSINEAVLLAQKFGPDHADAFVNGVLAKFTGKSSDE
ncbi:MAG: transcription antitermination factor NusB [Lachnospiraceae bacterium]|nr:transcription antitermination factor NusB [Lachnospiraceae bacterium]